MENSTDDKAFLKIFDFHNELIGGVMLQTRINIHAYNVLGQRTYIDWFEKIDGTVVDNLYQ
jgi:hypothetical protein